MTPDTSGPASVTPLASYDPDTSSWRTSAGISLSDSPKSLRPSMRSGMTSRGRWFALPMLEPAISEHESSSLLLSPSAGDGTGGGRKNPPPRGEGTKRGSGGLREQVRTLLPTPAAAEPGGTVEQYHERLRKTDGREPTFTPLGILVQKMMPTPTSRDWKGRNQRDDDTCLPGAVTKLPSTATPESSDDAPPTPPMTQAG